MKCLLLCGVMLMMARATPAAQPSDIVIERVFGPETPGAEYKHPASITELANGDLYLAYYGGSGEYGADTKVFGARLVKGSAAWTAPQVIADTPFRSEGNGVVWQAPDGFVWLFYVVRYGDTWSSSRIQAKISRDGANTWSDPITMTFEEGMMVQGRPLVLNSGDYLLPIYHETGQDRELVGPDSASLFFRINPKTMTWTETGRIKSAHGNIQPNVVQMTDDYLIAYCRRGGGYEPTKDGYIIRSESHDGGQTWSEGVNSAFPNPNAAIAFLKLQNGHLLLIFNDSMNDRSPLTAAISTDGDKTYPYRRNLIEGNDDFAYPHAFQAKDGAIHLVFTSHARTVVNHAVFSEEAILNAPGK